MTLCVVGRDGVDTLEQWVRAMFSVVRDNGSRIPSDGRSPFDHPCARAKLIHTVPVKDTRSVALHWVVQEQKTQYRAGPARYVESLLGYEGPGSVLALLKELGWAAELQAGVDESLEGFAVFGVRISLTEEGLARWQAVVGVVYSFIAMLRSIGVQHWRWEEAARRAAMQFRFLNKTQPAHYAVDTSCRMLEYPREHVFSGGHLLYDFDEAGVRAVLGALAPALGRVIVSAQAPAVAKRCTQTEQWYGTQYACEDLPAALLQRWEAAAVAYGEQALTAAHDRGVPKGGYQLAQPLPPCPRTLIPEADSGAEASAATDAAQWLPWVVSLWPKLSLSPPNPFIPESFDLVNPVLRNREQGTSPAPAAESSGPARLPRDPLPALVRHDGRATLWHYMDETFAQPKTWLFVDVELPAAMASARNAALRTLFCGLVNEVLNELAYDAGEAGLGMHVSPSARGVSVSIGGFSDKLAVLAEAVGKCIANLQFSDVQFGVLLDQTARANANKDMMAAYTLAADSSTVALSAPAWQFREERPAYADLSANEFRSFCSGELLREAFILALVSGNATRDDATKVFAAFADPVMTAAAAVPASVRGVPRVVALPPPLSLSLPGQQPVPVSVAFEWRMSQAHSNPEEENHAMEVLCQLGPCPAGAGTRKAAMIKLLAQIIGEPYFDTLRTKQQLGYIVNGGVKTEYSVDYIRFIVQSAKVSSPAELVDRTDEFLLDFVGTLRGLTDEKLESYKQAVLATELVAPQSTHAEASRLWTSVRGPLDFKKYVCFRICICSCALSRSFD
jgi:secreted Zn-dependent insulinase-like peptidase